MAARFHQPSRLRPPIPHVWIAGSRGQRNTSREAGKVTCRKEGSLKRGRYRARQRPFTEAEVGEIWTRRAAGEAGNPTAPPIGSRARSGAGLIPYERLGLPSPAARDTSDR